MPDMPVTPVSMQKDSITRFGGVDFTSNQTQVDARRSPDAVNMISDEKFFPVKRTGWLSERDYGAAVYGLHRYATDYMTYMIIHAGGSLYALNSDEPVYSGMAEAPSQSFTMGGALYLLDGKALLKLTEEEYTPEPGEGEEEPPATARRLVVKRADADPFVPTTSISRSPAGAGTSFEAVNLLTPKRKNSFKGDGTAKAYQLDGWPVEEGSVTATVDNAAITAFTVNYDTGIVTFTSAPSNNKGVDNVIITFSTVKSYADDINKCRICGLFGGQNDTRVFVSGNPEKQNVDWQSGLYDPAYFPDTGYSKVGGDASAIMGYARQYDTQIIIKEGNGQDATQWLRTFSLDGELRPFYALAQGAVGAGAVGRRTFDTLGDEPLFLSPQGVYAVVGTTVAQQRAIQSRSELINQRLISEPGLSGAVAAVHRGKYYLAVNGHMYIADGGQTYQDATGVAQYEWYYWEGVPASALLSYQGALWFGTPDGRLCRFKDSREPQAYSDGGGAYPAWWSVPLTALNTLYRRKTVRDVAFMLMPFTHGQYAIMYRSDKHDWQIAREGSMSLQDFDDVDFNDWSWVCVRVPELSRTRRKERKAEVFQIRVQNTQAGTGFGLLGIEIIYVESGRVR